MSEKHRHFRKKQNHVINTLINFKEITCLPRTSSQIEVRRNYFSNYIYLKNMYKTLKGLGKIQFLSELIIFVIL